MSGDDLEVILPASCEVSYRGERLEVRPLTIGAVPRLVREVRPVLDALLDGDIDQLAGDDLGPLLQLIEAHGEGVFRATAIAIDRDTQWVAGGDVAEFIQLARTVIEVNRDFFIRNVVPLLASLLASRAGVGATSSSTSQPEGTH